MTDIQRNTYYALFECGTRVSGWCRTEAAVMKEAHEQCAVISNRTTGDALASGYVIKRGSKKDES